MCTHGHCTACVFGKATDAMACSRARCHRFDFNAKHSLLHSRHFAVGTYFLCCHTSDLCNKRNCMTDSGIELRPSSTAAQFSNHRPRSHAYSSCAKNQLFEMFCACVTCQFLAFFPRDSSCSFLVTAHALGCCFILHHRWDHHTFPNTLLLIAAIAMQKLCDAVLPSRSAQVKQLLFHDWSAHVITVLTYTTWHSLRYVRSYKTQQLMATQSAFLLLTLVQHLCRTQQAVCHKLALNGRSRNHAIGITQLTLLTCCSCHAHTQV